MTTELHRQRTAASRKTESGTTVYAGALSSSTDLGGQQLGYLEGMLDQPTTRFIGEVTAREGQRCLDLGAGGGSIAHWLAGRTASTGQVTAVDIDDTHIAVPPAVRVYRHDVNEGLPDKGPFDVIHTRLLLVHLKRRREILAQLVDALAPGGWLITGEFTYPRAEPVTAPSRADSRLVQNVIETGINKVARPGGTDFEWGHEVDAELTAAGLHNVDTMELAQTSRGGATGCLLYSNYLHQMDAPLRAAGLTTDDLARFHELMFDPRLRVWFFPFVCTRGQKPVPA